ncbi:MAG: hypothetical protein K0R57_1492 [Paenibacillaceae bacterium]|jgi:hypothetical protein|nr:hypothetical protein [Paenibacillaceae bacterium]
MKRITAFLLACILLTGLAMPAASAAAAAGPLAASVNGQGQVAVKGTAGAGRQVTIRITAPDGRLEYIHQGTSGPDGSFSFDFKLSGSITGEYQVEVGEEGAASKLETEFVYNITPEVTPTPTPTSTPTPAPPEETSAPTPTQTTAPAPISTPPVQAALQYLKELADSQTPVTRQQANEAVRQAEVILVKLTGEVKEADIPSLLKHAADSMRFLSVIAGKAKNPAAAAVITDTALQLLAAMQTAAITAASQPGLQAAASSLAQAVSTVAAFLKVTADAQDRRLIIAETDAAVQTVTALLRQIQSSEHGVGIVSVLISGLGEMVFSGTEERQSEQLANRTAAAAQTVVNNVGKVTLVMEARNTTVANVSQAMEETMLNKADSAARVAAELQTKLLAGKILSKLTTQISVHVQNKNGTAAEGVRLPAGLTGALEAKGLHRLELVIGQASITLAPDAIAAAAGQPLTLSIRPLGSGDLTVPQQAAAQGQPVYEIQASQGAAGSEAAITDRFRSPVGITLPYALEQGEKAGRITAIYMGDSGETENMGGSYDPSTGQVVFRTAHFSKYVIRENKVQFGDAGEEHWAQAYIEELAAKGIVRGISDSVFAPDAPVTRAEFAALLVRALKLAANETAAVFPDVQPENWHYREVAAAHEAGLILGDGGRFHPDEFIKREDMAVMIARAALAYSDAQEAADPAIYLDFSDAGSISGYAGEAVALAVKYGIVNGTEAHRFEPQNHATRAEAVKMTALLLALD